MPNKFKEVLVNTDSGGRLITSRLPTQVRASSWIEKTDWRRGKSTEDRTEGYDEFYPKTTEALGVQNFPGLASPIIFVGTLNRANGDRAFICATATDIYRYISYDNNEYFVPDAIPYYDAGYFESLTGHWKAIGTGFSANTTRWEAVTINSQLVMNNGIDLPVTHRFEESVVKPIYELRDNGVARVGTIAKLNDVLMCFDIYQIKEVPLADIRDPLVFDGVTAMQAISGYQPSNPVCEWWKIFRNNTPSNPSLIVSKINHSWDVGSLEYGGSGWFLRDRIGDMDINKEGVLYQDLVAVVPPVEEGGPILALDGGDGTYASHVGEPRTIDYHEIWVMFQLKDVTIGGLYIIRSNCGFITMSGDKLVWSGTGQQVPPAEQEITGIVKEKWYVARMHISDTGTEDDATPFPLTHDTVSHIEVRDLSDNVVFRQSITADSFRTAPSVAGWGFSGYTTQVMMSKEVLTDDEAVKIWRYYRTRYNGAEPGNDTNECEFAELHDGAPVSAFAEKKMKKITATTAIFAAADANQEAVVVWSEGGRGFRDLVEAFTDTSNVTVLTDDERPNQAVTKYLKGTLMTSTKNAGATLLAVGKIVEFENGVQGKIVSLSGGSPEVATLDTTDFIYPARDFTLRDDVATNFHVVATGPVFTAAMVGESILFDSGEERKIIAFVDTQTVTVNKDEGIPTTGFRVTNVNHYSAVTTAEDVDRFSYRAFWSAIDEPHNFAATAKVKVVAGSRTIVLDSPVKWIECGCSITITGVGINQGNLTADIQSVSHGNTVIRISEIPVHSLDETLIQSTAQIGNIVGFDELNQDGRAILKAVPLDRNRLIIYKEMLDGKGSIFICNYTGRPAAPFRFEQVYEGPNTPLYSESIIEVMGEWHLFIGQNALYRFDATSQHPREIEFFQFMEESFFKEVDKSLPHQVFARDNTITKEIILFFPGGNCIRYDYRYNTVSRSVMPARSGAMVRRPNSSEEWFIMGLADGTLIRNGIVAAEEVPVTASQTATTVTATAGAFDAEHVGRSIRWADDTVYAITAYISSTQVTVDTSATIVSTTATVIPAIWHRMGASYDSTLRSGLDSWNGKGFNSVLLERYQLRLGRRTNGMSATVSLMGAKEDLAESAVKVISMTDLSNTRRNCQLTRHFWGDKIVVSGKNNPVSLVGRVFRTKVIDTKGFTQ